MGMTVPVGCRVGTRRPRGPASVRLGGSSVVLVVESSEDRNHNEPCWAITWLQTAPSAVRGTPAAEEARACRPSDSERRREPRLWLLLAVQPIGAGRQLTTQCNDGCSRLGSWQREGAHENHGIGSQLTDRSGGLDEVSADDPQGWHGHKREFLTLPAGALRTPRFRRGSTFRGDEGQQAEDGVAHSRGPLW